MNDIVRNPWLMLGGALSIVAACVHLACLPGGAAWFRALGAGETMARMAEAGKMYPFVAALVIAAILTGFGAYALSGAGLLPRLPLLRMALVLVTGIYLARGLMVFRPSVLERPDLSQSFIFWSSVIVLAIGVIHLIGLWRSWTDLKGAF